MNPSDVPVHPLAPAGAGLAPGLQAWLSSSGALRRLACGELMLNLFPATELEAPLPGLHLRHHRADGHIHPVPLLGPLAPGRLHQQDGRCWVAGQWHSGPAGASNTSRVGYCAELVLANPHTTWFWHVQLRHLAGPALQLDLVMLQDLALAPWDALRLNEAYVSQYIDHQPLQDAVHGSVIASRQNAPVQGRHPWLLCGSLGRAVAHATDALQVLGLARRAGRAEGLLDAALPGQRLQHEHSLVALQDQAFTLLPGQMLQRGFFGCFEADHPAASSVADLTRLSSLLALPTRAWSAPPHAGWADLADAVGAADAAGASAASPSHASASTGLSSNAAANLFSHAPLWPADEPDERALAHWLASPTSTWRQVERDAAGRLLSCFVGLQRHVSTRAKELRVLRPHGHLMRSGLHWTPDEQAVASTAWMAGVFHSSLTQGHASANRCLSTQRAYLGLYRSQGQRVFVNDGGDDGVHDSSGWQLLDVPSAFEMDSRSARWFYAQGERLIVVSAAAAALAPEVSLQVSVRSGPPLQVLVVHHLALNGDDGLQALPVLQQQDGDALLLHPSAGTDMHQRFGNHGLRLQAFGAPWQVSGGDELLFADGQSRGLPYVCLRWAAVQDIHLVLRCDLIPDPAAEPTNPVAPSPDAATFDHAATAGLRLSAPAAHAAANHAAANHPAAAALGRLQDMAPWLVHNALVHYLSPRGLEQFSGGGWGTRDVCQGPAEWLLALGRFDALRDLLCRVFSAQNTDGDWPQWFMFYPRDAQVRAADSHGDIVFWPVLALADYLHASGDATLLDQVLPFHAGAGVVPEQAPLSEHLSRALVVINGRTITGTRLPAYGHGDWNDALQPANPAMREHLCSAWTTTLQVRTLRHLAAAWQRLGRLADAARLLAWAHAVQADFQRLLIADGVLAGYVAFDDPLAPRHLLHPREQATVNNLANNPVSNQPSTGIRYSALAMVHAIIDELFTPEQALAHVALIQQHLLGPDGLRLFDRPLHYGGGPMTLFQRGESASYFGREIGLMYMHAHLRWAEALAHLGHTDAFFDALQRAHPISLQALLPQAALRQANCYYSSSDAAFADRVEAQDHYGRILRGEVALEGGWRIYSSGAGIAFRLIVQSLLGLQQTVQALGIDPVLPTTLGGLRAELLLYGHPVQVHYQVGSAGFGPLAVALDGEALPLQPGHNRYRTPGVWVDAALLRSRLAVGARQLLITLG